MEQGSLREEPTYVTRHLTAIAAQQDNVQQPGQKAKEVLRQQRIAIRLALLTEKQRKAREAAVERRRLRRERGPLDVSALTGPSGPWQSICWWRTQPEWLEVPPEVDQHTWQRMIRWGMVPKDFDSLLMFAGMEQDARRLMCGRIGRSLREAAVNCIWHARSLTPMALPTRRPPAGEQNRHVIPGDRGIWHGTTAGGAKLAAAQLAQHEISLQPARTKAANEAAAMAELNRIPTIGEPTRATTGCFLRVKLGKTAGGHFVAASNSDLSLRQFQKDKGKTKSRAWSKLPRWWSWSNEREMRGGARFNGILRPIDGVCGTRTAGVCCSRGGYRGQDGRIKCAPCRAHHQPDDVIGCDICGRAAVEGLLDWVSMGRFDMVCDLCAKATIAQAPNQWCDCCGTNKATQTTADSSAACQTCGDNFSQMEGWLARAQRLCGRAIRRLGAPASRFTEEAARDMWLWTANRWAHDSGTDFCGNAITWNNISSTVLEWMDTHGLRADKPSLHAEQDGSEPAWTIQQKINVAVDKAQRTLMDFGFQGGTISITRPVFASPGGSAHRRAPPRFHPLVADRSSLRARTQQKSRRAVGSTVSVPRQGRAALAPGPMGTRTTLELKSGGRDRTAQLASDTSPTRSGAFAPAVDVRPRPLDTPSVTHESTAGGQGGSFYVQCRHPARIAGGSRIKGSRPHCIQTTAIHKTSQWSRQTTTAQRIAITASLEARAWKISKDRHVTRPPE